MKPVVEIKRDPETQIVTETETRIGIETEKGEVATSTALGVRMINDSYLMIVIIIVVDMEARIEGGVEVVLALVIIEMIELVIDEEALTTALMGKRSELIHQELGKWICTQFVMREGAVMATMRMIKGTAVMITSLIGGDRERIATSVYGHPLRRNLSKIYLNQKPKKAREGDQLQSPQILKTNATDGEGEKREGEKRGGKRNGTRTEDLGKVEGENTNGIDHMKRIVKMTSIAGVVKDPMNGVEDIRADKVVERNHRPLDHT